MQNVRSAGGPGDGGVESVREGEMADAAAFQAVRLETSTGRDPGRRLRALQRH